MIALHVTGTWVFLIVLSLVTAGSAAYGQQEDETPAEADACAKTNGAAHGICVAFCEAKDCDEEDEPSPACQALRRNFERRTGSARFPCEAEDATPTATATAAATATNSRVPDTAAPSETAGLPTATATVTDTVAPDTATPTATETVSVATVTATTTDTPVPDTATATATDTRAAEPATATPTETVAAPTATVTPSSTATATPTVPAPTSTDTPTASPTSSATATRTLTPTPRATPPLSARDCGNNAIEPGEECDDGNQVDGDGCSAVCQSELQPDPCRGIVPTSGVQLTAVRVAGNLTQPLYATSPPGDFDRLFIVEQGGRIRILRDGQVLTTPFLDLRTRVIAGGELGLLGLAFHPAYATNGEFFVDYTTQSGGGLRSVVARFRVSANPDQADPESEEILLEQPQPFISHNGGQLAFDAAGYLYISFGDGGQSLSTQNNAQDPDTWLGKILRIDIDGGTPYAIPADNPFMGPDGVLDEIWAMGFRNPWRVSFDRLTGDMYVGDVGEASREEIDILSAAAGGANCGWCCEEGTLLVPGCFQRGMTCPADGLTPPVLEYDHLTGCSVTGGFVYRGCQLPDLHGTYFYGDFCTAFIRSFSYVNGMVQDERDWTTTLAPTSGHTIDRIASFGEDARGELYICDLGGEVFKIVPAPPP